MKLVWKKKVNTRREEEEEEDRAKKRKRSNLPFDSGDCNDESKPEPLENGLNRTADSLISDGNRLAENGKFRDALGKWEAALALVPGMAILHEQKAQVLLELGDSWSALKSATRATELEPSWAEAWITLGRAQLNFGEPYLSLKSFATALEIKPGHKDALSDRDTALQLVKMRKQLHSSGSSPADSRFMVGEKGEDTPLTEENTI